MSGLPEGLVPVTQFIKEDFHAALAKAKQPKETIPTVPIEEVDLDSYARELTEYDHMKHDQGWNEEALKLIGHRRDATNDYAQTTSNMRQQLKNEQDDLRVKSYAMQVKQFFLRLDPRRAKMFVRELTGSEQGDWQKLFGYLDEIPDPPAKRLNPSYEKSKTYARTLRATRNYEKAIDAARTAYDRAKAWNAFLDKKAEETAPALPAPQKPKALSLRAESVTTASRS